MMFVMLYRVLILSIALIEVKCARILGIFPAPGYSQYIIGSELLIPLAQKGHDVTVISEHETKGVKNYKHVLISKEEQKFNSEDMMAMGKVSSFGLTNILFEYGEDITLRVLSHPNVQNLLHSNETFDLIIIETIYNEALLAFATHYNAKLIAVNSMGLNEWTGYLVGNIMPPSYVPSVAPGYSSKMTFYERTRNTISYLYDGFLRKYYGLPKQQQFIDKYFPKSYNVHEAIDRIDLLLINGHPCVTGVVPLTHAVKEIGGFHINPPKKLPNDIKAFLDSADKGAIIFSMGSNLKSSDMPKHVLEKVISDFGKLQQKVLWKFETPNVKLPKNVMISKWLPQRDIMSHPNIVAFISHGGLLSFMESMHYGIPMVGVPGFVDQFMNVQRLVSFGVGVHVPFDNLANGSLLTALNEVISNPSYKKKAMERSKILRDRLVSPVDEAVYWVEYVLRHDSIRFLRSPELDLAWYQVYLLDVIGLFVGIIVCVGIVVKCTCNAVCKKSQPRSIDNKKNK